MSAFFMPIDVPYVSGTRDGGETNALFRVINICHVSFRTSAPFKITVYTSIYACYSTH